MWFNKKKDNISVPSPKKNNKPVYASEELRKAHELIDKDYLIVNEAQKKFSKVLLTCLIILFLLIATTISLIILRIDTVILVLYLIFVVPLTLIILGVMIVRFFMNFTKTKYEFQKKHAGNLLHVHIFMPDRKTISFFVSTVKDYFKYEDGEYFINEKCIWKDFNSIMNSYYFYGIPNPIMLNFRASIERYLKYFTDKTRGLSPEKVVVDGFEVEVGYNSENIKLLRQDNFINQLHGAGDMGVKDIVVIILVVIVLLLQIVNFFKAPVVVKDAAPVETAKQIIFLIGLMRLGK